MLSLLGWAYSCSLVIGDIPPAGHDSASNGGHAGSTAPGDDSSTSGGEAGAFPSNAGGSGGTLSAPTSGGTGGISGDGGSQSGDGGTNASAGTGAASGGNASGGSATTAAGGSVASGGSEGEAGAPGAGGAGAGSGASGGGCDPCDCDDDGALSAACEGDDCDDEDDRVFPGQVLFFTTPSDSVGFDYNCDNRSEREFQDPVACTGLALLGCESENEGFHDSLPACGQSSSWGGCVVDGLACVNDQIDMRLMRCR